jgi:hypothetical protein
VGEEDTADLLDFLEESQALINPNQFLSEDGGCIYIRNVGNTAHVHMLQEPKKKITNIGTDVLIRFTKEGVQFLS